VGGIEKLSKIVQCAVARVNTAIVRNVIPVVSEGRWVHRQQPQAINPEVPEVAELSGEALEIADTIPVAVSKRLDVQLVDDRILVPKRLRGFRHCGN
jgi:hypothetical protein